MNLTLLKMRTCLCVEMGEGSGRVMKEKTVFIFLDLLVQSMINDSLLDKSLFMDCSKSASSVTAIYECIKCTH